MVTGSMEQRLQALLDREALIELVHAYCNAADREDHAKMRALYHEDALDDHGSFFKGLAMEFIDRLPEIQAPMEILHHNVTTVNLKLDGDTAEGEVYVIAFHQVRTAKGLVDLLVGGRYLDKYSKRDGVWKFQHRLGIADWAHLHEPTLVDLGNDFVSAAVKGARREQDPSYGFFSLFKRGRR